MQSHITIKPMNRSADSLAIAGSRYQFNLTGEWVE